MQTSRNVLFPSRDVSTRMADLSTSTADQAADLASQLAAETVGSASWERLRNDLVVLHLPALRHIAGGYAKRHGASSADFSVVHSVVLEAALKHAHRWDPALGVPFPVYCRSVTRNAIAAWSSSRPPVSSAAAASRKARILANTDMDLRRTLRRPPTAQERVDAFNAHVRARFSRRTMPDVTVYDIAALEALRAPDALDQHSLIPGSSDGESVDQALVEAIRTAVVEDCRPEAARVFLAAFHLDEGDERWAGLSVPVAELSVRFDAPLAAIRRYLVSGRAAAARGLLAYYDGSLPG